MLRRFWHQEIIKGIVSPDYICRKDLRWGQWHWKFKNFNLSLNFLLDFTALAVFWFPIAASKTLWPIGMYFTLLPFAFLVFCWSNMLLFQASKGNRSSFRCNRITASVVYSTFLGNRRNTSMFKWHNAFSWDWQMGLEDRWCNTSRL
jgi:hypothetical protein